MLNILKYIVIQMIHKFNSCIRWFVINMNGTINCVYLDNIIKVLFYQRTVKCLELYEVIIDKHNFILLIQYLSNLALVVWYFNYALIELFLWNNFGIGECNEC